MSLQVWFPFEKDLNNYGLLKFNNITGTPTFDNTDGMRGSCYIFGPNYGVFHFPTQSWMKMYPENNFSLFMWIKGAENGGWLIAQTGWELMFRTNLLRVSLSGNGQYPADNNTITIDPNTWYHYGFTWNGATGKLRLYLNGNKIGESDVPSTALFNINSTMNLPYSVVRKINDFRIYDETLSDAQIKSLYHYYTNGQKNNKKLVLWMPFTTDKRNQGVENWQISSGASNINIVDDGKLGKCAKIQNNSGTFIPTTGLINNCLTLSAWVKTTASGSWQRIFGFNTDRSSNNTQYFYFADDPATKCRFKLEYAPSIQMCKESSNTTPIINEWHHVALVLKDNAYEGWLDGVKKTESAEAFTIGNLINVTIGGGNSMGLYLNDFRVYNYNLSANEIKNIYKSEILHYHLNRSEPSENLIINLVSGGNTTIINNNTIQTNGANSDTYFYFKFSKALVVGTTYTIACKTNFNKGESWGFQIGGNNSGNVPITLRPGYNEQTFTCSSGMASMNFSLFLIDDTSGSARTSGNKYLIYDWVLQEGDHITCPPPTALGYKYNYLKEYDGSGHINDGTRIGTLIQSNNSARYKYSAIFSTNPSSLVANSTFKNINTFTYNCWFKANSIKAAFLLMGHRLGNNVYRSLTLYKDGTLGFHYYQPTDKTIKANNITYTANTWNMFTATYDGSTIKVYVNGIFAGQGSETLQNPQTDFSINYPDTNSSGREFYGLLSDIRVFATALSDNDIIELYQMGHIPS